MSDSNADRTAQRVRRQALAMEMLQRLRPALLHELRGPMQAILSAAHMLRKSSDPMPGAESAGRDHYADVIRGSVQQLIAISDTMLPDGSAVDGAPAPCKLPALTERVIRLLRDLAALEGVALTLEVDPAGVPDLRAHQDALQLALTAILVRTLERTPANAGLRVVINATPAALRWRVHAPRHPDYANPDATVFDWRPELAPSLGWNVARDIVAEHGGTVHVTDQGGHGWTLSLEFPLGSDPAR